MIKMFARLFSCVFGLVLSYSLYGQCSFPGQLPILDLRSQTSYLRIDNAINNDLSTAGQGICEVNIKFTHGNVGDIDLFLSSPEGKTYQLIKQGGSRSTNGTTWDIRFIPCSSTPEPDMGNFLKPVWDSDQAWGENNNYRGSYHAETCLETINTGPVNGIWTLTVNDVTSGANGTIESFSLGFCDPTGITCSECTRAGGIINRDTVLVCGGDPSLGAIRIFPTYSGIEPDPAAYTYRFIVRINGRILDITRLPDLQSAPAGDYYIYGISVANQDLDVLESFIGNSFNNLTAALTATRLSFCAAFSNGFKLYRILSDPSISTKVVKFVCPEAPLLFNGNTITTPGTYNATLVSSTGCDSMVELRVVAFDITTPIIDPGLISCANKPLTLSWTNTLFSENPGYLWTTNDGSILSGNRTANAQIDLPGTYQLAIAKDGCVDTLSISVNSDGSIPELLIDDIVMDCTANIGQLRPVSDASSFSWTGPFGFTANNQNIDVTEPGAYTVTAVGPTCAVRKTVMVGADFERPENVMANGGSIRCQNDSVQLTASSTSPGVQYTWKGPGGFSSTAQNPVVEQAGIYTVQIGPPNSGCSETLEVEVFSLFNEPSISLTGVVLDCRGLAKRITTTVSDNFATFEWTGPGGYKSADKSPLVRVPGNYNVKIRDANQCEYSAVATVSIDTTRPEVTASDFTLGCMQDSFMLAATYTSLHPATFTWSGPNNFSASELNAVASQAGTYTIRVLDPVNGCSATTSMMAIPNPLQPKLSTNQVKLNCDQSQDTMVVTANCSGGCLYAWDGPNAFSNSSDSAIITEAGLYNIKVTDLSNGCYSWARFSVTQDTTPIVRNVQVVPIGCTTPGSVTLVNTSQIREFSWIDTVRRDTVSTPTVSTTNSATFLLESIDINGCELATQVFEVGVQDDVPEVTVTSQPINCANDSVFLQVGINNYPVSQVTDYLWNLPDNRTSTAANPRVGSAGNVEVEIKMANGCIGKTTGIVTTDFTEPVLSAHGGSFPCLDTGVVLQIDVDRPALSTYWTGPNGFQSYQETPLASVPGIYTLQILGANGCAASDTALVSFSDPLPSLSVFGDTITCFDTAGNLSFTTDALAGFNFRWLDPGGRINLNRDITTILVGPYQMELVDINGCKAVATATIDIDTISFGAKVTSELISCNIPATELSLDTLLPFLSYSWIFDSTDISNFAQPTVDSGGLYTLITTNVNGCQRMINHVVIADTVRPVFSLLPDTLNCENNRITLRSTPFLSGVTYAWSGPGDLTSNSGNLLVTEPGQYSLEITSANGCKRVEMSRIEASFEVPSFIIDSTFLPCSGDSASLSFQTTDTLKETNWFGPDGYYRATISAQTLTPGTYYLLAKGLNGCEAFDSQFVSAIPLLDSLNISSQQIDCTHPIGFVRIENVQPGFEYNVIDQSNDTIAATEIQTAVSNRFVIEATHLDSRCVMSAVVDIPLDTLPPVLSILEMDSIICDHREISLGSMVEDTVSYQWSTTSGNLVGPTNRSSSRLDQPGLYFLDVQSLSNGCMNQESILIEERFNNLTAIFAESMAADCLGNDDGLIVIDSVRGGSGPFKFSINNEFFTTQNVFNYLSPGQYQVFTQDVNGCSYDTLLNVGRVPSFMVNLGDDQLIVNLGDTLDLQLHSGLSPGEVAVINWFLPDSTSCQDCYKQAVSPLQNTFYKVQVTSTDGCTISDSILVRVADPGGLFIPNAFTPNNDGVNDFLEVLAGNNIDEISGFEIFDRWGNNVFSAFDFNPGEVNARWDGTFRGQALNPGVYIYVVRAIDIRGSAKISAGDITLLR
ncbi:MAG: T9SS type B sorting domain-containing protein [Saprospiraceae bacterium]|nr:T9SS type B sorting domain-containing protein [Saprospiraceae bacterium]